MRASEIRRAGDWSGAAADSVVLDFEGRCRRRVMMQGVRGLEFLLDLPQATLLRSGDGLVLDDGRIVEVLGAPEPLVELRATNPQNLLRLAWHIGNRHVQAQLTPTALRIRRDPILEDLARRLGAQLRPIEAPFDPEGGAYAQASEHSHNHSSHDHSQHDHSQHDHSKYGVDDDHRH